MIEACNFFVHRICVRRWNAGQKLFCTKYKAASTALGGSKSVLKTIQRMLCSACNVERNGRGKGGRYNGGYI